MVHQKRRLSSSDPPLPSQSSSESHQSASGSTSLQSPPSERNHARDLARISTTRTTGEIPNDTQATNDSDMLSPSALQRLILCPLCQDHLVEPTTLRCGHSICARHVTSSDKDPPPTTPVTPTTLPLCPLSNCLPKPISSSILPRIPSSSRINYRPAPPEQDAPSLDQHKTIPEPHVDVTLNKIISLVGRANQSLRPSTPQPPSELSDDDDDDPSADLQVPPYSSALHRSDSRPHKRRRRNTINSPQTTEQEDDLLSHLQKQSVRQRTLRHDEPLIPSSQLPPHDSSSSTLSRDATLARFEKDLLAELTCEICFVLYFQPTTTPCQHTFCGKCLQRSLDHSSACPLCRQTLPGFTYFQDHPSNKTILSIVLEAFPLMYQERAEAIALEERDSRLDTPIFVCQLSFPGMPTLLHFFEPRYRLMLRRCLESETAQFGMIMAPKPGAGSTQVDYGTMLEIRSIQMLSDGRSMVETWGSFRFRVLERGTLDGYMVGRIERIDDYPEDLAASSLLFPLPLNPVPAPNPSNDSSDTSEPQPPPSPLPPPPPTGSTSSTEPPLIPSPTNSQNPTTTHPSLSIPIHTNLPTNEDLMTICRSFLDRLRRGTAPWVVQRLSSAYGTIPTDPSAFSFWVALVLPIDEHEKAKLLPLRSARLRLLLLVHWIEQLNNQWYAFVWKMVACVVWTVFVLTVSRLVGFI